MASTVELRRASEDRILAVATPCLLSAKRVAGHVPEDGRRNRKPDKASRRASGVTYPSTTAHDASGSGAGHGTGYRCIPGPPGRFVDGKALASYVGIIPREYSSGGNQRLGRITKQGSPLLRFLWCEAVLMRYAKIRSCSVSIAANWFTKVWGERAWRSHASSGSDCGSCCGTRLTTKSSVVADRSTKVVQPVRDA